MELSDLKTTLTELSDQELFDLIKGIRASRRTPKATTSTKPKAARKAKAESPTSIDALLSALSPEQIEDLIKQMEAM